MSRYLKPRGCSYLMEAAVYTKVLEGLRRIEAKYARTMERKGAVRQVEFGKVMQHHSKREPRDDFGWGFITEAQYDRYRLLFRQGQTAMERLLPTKSELAPRLVRRIIAGIDADCQEQEFSTLSPGDQQAERAWVEQSQREWKRKTAELKWKCGIIEAGEDMGKG